MKLQSARSAFDYLNKYCYDTIKPQKREKCLKSIFMDQFETTKFLYNILAKNEEETEQAFEIVQKTPFYIGLLFKRMNVPEPYRTNCFELVINSEHYNDLLACTWRLSDEEKKQVINRAENDNNPEVKRGLLYSYMADKKYDLTIEKIKSLLDVIATQGYTLRETFEMFHRFPEEIQIYIIDKIIEHGHFRLIDDILKEHHKKLTKGARAKLRSIKIAGKLLE